MIASDVAPWTVTARNLPHHARNPIHTDAGAQAQGFPRALVAGVTTYAYLTHPVAAAWGQEWMGGGGGELRLRRPVFDGDVVTCRPTPDGDAVVIDALTTEDEARATFRAVADGGPAPAMRQGEVLRSRQIVLADEYGSDYGWNAGDDLGLYRELGIVHPAVWPAVANTVVHADVARGSWIHMRSIIRHHAVVPAGSVADVHAVVVRRYQRSGERAVLDVRIEVDGRPVATLEHEAIVDLSTA
jgi:acyl dehydratase